jgi:hypothetical protein
MTAPSLDFSKIATDGIKLPYAIPLIALGILPIAFAVIAIVACLPACLGACCCSAGVCYSKKNKKLQKASIEFLHSENISV